ncbi:methyltransferase domain-containing protein [Citrobacter koseri]|uniref:methyltransferase domain-containing protein n=1 Tax=Citrobacter koseri TaxID=545 RepID=UPI00190560E3|nr:methyltransferase domain-containing protein [Citrobacter koseri]MBJ8670257.1 methyltransferase domain-containing protein [Citrobacter koseri]
MTLFSNELQNGLVWLPELGMGRYPVPADRPYNADYFARYQAMADTSMGQQLTAARIQLVMRHYQGPVLDVGIGSGQFVSSYPGALGFDVNPAGMAWLHERNAYADLYASRWRALTMWDVLEHIDDPERAVRQAKEFVFVSLPIFDNAEHILTSRHYRKDEHIWYWTHEGLLMWFEAQGFTCVEHNTIESRLGRDGISSYAFRRK